MKKYKLYNRETGYKCRVTINELNFLFKPGEPFTGYQDANNYLIQTATGYYITE